MDTVGSAALATVSDRSGVSVHIGCEYLSGIPLGHTALISATVTNNGARLATVKVRRLSCQTLLCACRWCCSLRCRSLRLRHLGVYTKCNWQSLWPDCHMRLVMLSDAGCSHVDWSTS